MFGFLTWLLPLLTIFGDFFAQFWAAFAMGGAG